MEGKGQGWAWWPGVESVWEPETPSPRDTGLCRWVGAQIIALERVAWRLGGPTRPLLRAGAQGPPFHPGPRVGGQALSSCIQHLPGAPQHKALAFIWGGC